MFAGYHKLSMDHTRCKQANHMGMNTASWHPGTCKAAGYSQLMNQHSLGPFQRQMWVKPDGMSPSQLANYKIPSWADPHYSAAGDDRNFG
ncbi:hypothetical protein GUITHDRAFT_110220 [Guillardia theta CCMP2712]|uniref:Uncharacterized protein n=1 Tax=Guillardia theta (strain CCMP2712) TaxID=905079 RepID=L1J6R6_GUITC|nr:hypothetical protein GUITHDRAFT_110220 [Guillardia theta CCMP2712]EKX43765.1 hypothetical protein GUITHDRAFT_110220 [Guillardia theta CCMP2712]|eukprot:XP_005830745.1 hypothetical protein GUITHDRAFT_110220 [Guillardia theta CCMP2712]